MKQTLLLTIFSIAMATLMTACTGQKVDNLADNLTENMASVGKSTLSSDPCSALDKKLFRLDRFTEVVKNTSAFHLEEKARAIPTPGITVSNNRKQMLRDADKKYTEYAAERQKYGCETPMTSGTGQIADKTAVVDNPTLSSDPHATIDKELTTKVNNTSAVHVEEKARALPVPEITVSNNKEQMLRDAKKKDAEHSAERQKNGVETPMSTSTAPMAVVDNPTLSSDSCDAIDKELIKLYEFMIMLNNTSAFHLEEKARALPVPGITVSNNKKQMLRDAERKRAELSAEREKYGCETPEKE